MNIEHKDLFAHAVSSSEEVDVRQVLVRLWAGRWWMLGGSLLGMVLGCLIALSLPNEYKVTATLGTPLGSASNGASGMMGGLGGLAAMVGVSLPGDSAANTSAYLATLNSNSFLADFIRDQSLKPVLFPKRWDAVHHVWRPRAKPGLIKQMILNIVDDPAQIGRSELATMEPSDFEAAQYFNDKVLLASQDRKTDLVTLTITWNDPIQATQWLDLLVKRLNSQVRADMINDADKSIAYLRQQAQITPEVEVREAIYGLMQVKLKSRMVAAVNEDAAFRTVDAPLAPTAPASPKRFVIVLGAMLLGGALVAAVVLVRGSLT